MEQRRHGCSNADYPQEDRQKNPSDDFLCPQVRERVDHSYIPVDSHDGQEEDAAVEASEEDKSHNFAQNLRVQPAPDMVNGPEREAGGEDEVRDGQIENENVGERLEILVQSQDYKDEDVSCEAQCDHDSEENRNGKGSKSGHILFVTDFVLRVIVIVKCAVKLIHC